MMMLRAGEKLLVCEVCESQRIIPITTNILKQGTICKRCEHTSMRVKKASPTNIRGAGRNKVADMGLALLMEMGAGASDLEEKKDFLENSF